MDQYWGVFVPTWVAAVSTLLGLGAASIAALFAWRALHGERERDERATAYGLSAWWAVHTGEVDKEWGVVISNSSTAVFHNVEVGTKGNDHLRGTEAITVTTLPPGLCFIRSLPRKGARPWGPRTSVNDLGEYQPITATDKWVVTEMTFTDLAARRWSWRPVTGLKRQSLT